MPDRDLWAGLVRTHQCFVGRLGGSDSAAGSLRSGGHQRCFQSSLGCGCGSEFRKNALGAVREFEQKPGSPQRHPSALLRAGSDTEKKNGKIENPVEQALRVTDLLLQSGGFGLVIIDLGDTPLKMAHRIPLTSWFRFQRVVEHTATVLFVVSQVPCARTCASLLLKVSGTKLSALSCQLSAETSPAHAQLLNGLQVHGELLRSRLERKPTGSVTTAFTTKVG